MVVWGGTRHTGGGSVAEFWGGAVLPGAPPAQEGLFSSAWSLLSNKTRMELEQRLDCCGLLNRSADPPAAHAFQADFPVCPAVSFGVGGSPQSPSPPPPRPTTHPISLPPPKKCKTLLGKDPHAKCLTCGEKMLQHLDEALKILGGVGLFFSFTEILGVWLAMRYRNQKDPRANPSAFL
ncbi:hypothetical protein QYF61_007532 [Mycteria americana]|uniref:Tetraspanin 31 n=1 Tax=Mycteria americana TaxID=33587 RepID=A0AAN7RHA0_MYCAM|nr:hypothetical protein QYF61_007532 [Mycteria americana]